MTNKELIFSGLSAKYQKATLSKSEVATELGLSTATLDRYLALGEILPPHHKLGEAKTAKVIFSIIDIAEFLQKKTRVKSYNGTMTI